MKAEAEALLLALREAGLEGARARMPALLEAVRAPLDGGTTRELLQALRSRRCFGLLGEFAERAALVSEGALLVHVKRQLAQALIDQGLLTPAGAMLEALSRMASGKERSEVIGLLGRVQKQRFVEAVKAGGKGERELRASVDAYRQVYDHDPAWHGANLVALLARAERDGIALEGERAQAAARRLLDDLQAKARPEWTAWDHAAEGEAWLALGDRVEIARAFREYWSAPGADGFALGGTARQLREIWQLDPGSGDELLGGLPLQLEARALSAGGEARYAPADLPLVASRLEAARGRAEALFGEGSAYPLGLVLGLIGKARSVCRITDPYDPRRGGTGFLVSGRDLTPGLDGVLLLTNHHVLHGQEATEAQLASRDYLGSVDARRAVAEFHCWGTDPAERRTIRIGAVIRASPRPEADFALATLSEPLPADRALSIDRSLTPLGSPNFTDGRQRPKVFVVGHPQGGTLCFSLTDNTVVDHELTEDPRVYPRRIHYRAPTEPGSSGSPVFHHRSLDVVGLHRTGRVGPLRPDWPRAGGDAEYQANEAVAIRSIAELAQTAVPKPNAGGAT